MGNRPKDKAEYIRRLRIIYDSFEIKDLTFDSFRNQMLDITDPSKIMDDLGDVQLKKARQRLNKMRIDRATGGKQSLN